MAFERTELQRPPVREVAASYVFKPELSYSLAPGRLLRLLADRLPQFSENPNGLWGPSMHEHRTGPLHRFSDSEQRNVIQVGHGMLSINRVGEYDYPAFCDFVRFGLKAMSDAGILGKVENATLRYINVISDELSAGLEAPLRVSWCLPATGLDNDSGFQLRFAQSLGEGTPLVFTSIHRQDEQDGKQGTVLDFVTQDGDPENLDTWIKHAHDRTYQAFRNVIGDELHARMEGIGQ